MKFHRTLAILLLLISASGVYALAVGTPRYRLFSAPLLSPSTANSRAAPGVLRFAAVGDYGMGNQAESDVAQLIKSWNPEFVITLGDNNYPNGQAATIDGHIGKDYADFIFPYLGDFGPGAEENRFFPALGNHDWVSLSCVGDVCSGPYLDYFTLPGNERYYDFVWGPVHFFVIDSDPREPHGRSAESVQAQWLRQGLAASLARWKLVYMHHTIYSSSLHGSEPLLQWPYKEWGAHGVLTGHDHTYERVMIDGVPYFVNGMGGAGIRTFGAPVPGSVLRYNGDHGAQLIEADDGQIRFRFINRSGALIDDFVLEYAAPMRTPTPTSTTSATPTPTPTATRTPIPASTAPPQSTPGTHLYLPEVNR